MGCIVPLSPGGGTHGAVDPRSTPVPAYGEGLVRLKPGNGPVCLEPGIGPVTLVSSLAPGTSLVILASSLAAGSATPGSTLASPHWGARHSLARGNVASNADVPSNKSTAGLPIEVVIGRPAGWVTREALCRAAS